ncbi:MAG: gliding motility protein RemB [Mucilaginibacter sp.]|nr:gliding motility protein RemB [Mucilaginibacter sp.]
MINNTYFVAMQNIYHFPIKKVTLIAAIIVFTVQFGKAQSVYLPYSYQLDQKFNSSIYSINSSFHTSLKPFLIDSLIAPRYNELMNVGVDSTRHGWIVRKLLNEHLFDVKTKEYTFYGDYLPDLQLGRDFNDHITTYANTRGYQFGGTVGTKFFFYTSGYENQSKFPTYYNNVISTVNIVPGQSYDRHPGASYADWSYVTAILSYTPIKQLNITMGEDRTFIGDGYRSLLLSDFAPNYPLLRLTANLGKVQYMIQWAYMNDQRATRFDSFGNQRRKWGAFHYLDWNITNRLSLGYFDAIIMSEANDKGNFHGFDPNFINPIVYTNSINSTPSQPDNALMGFTAKYKIFDKAAIYGQLLLDRVSGSGFFSGGNNSNTNGVQLGIRGADLFKVKDFNYLFEFNTVKPYTYASAQPITSYTNFEEPLGDPLGANFREFIGILNYSIGRFDFMGQVNYAKYGTDPQNADFGKNVNLPYVPSTTATSVGQGITTSLYYGEGTISYLINPKYNLRLEGGALLRAEKSSVADHKTVMLTFGLRSTFRDLYHDF